MDDNKKFDRLRVAVYTIITIIGLFLAYIAFIRTEDFWHSLSLNLSTELLGVVIISIILTYFLFQGEGKSFERLSELKELVSKSTQDLPQLNDLERIAEELKTLSEQNTQESARTSDLERIAVELKALISQSTQESPRLAAIEKQTEELRELFLQDRRNSIQLFRAKDLTHLNDRFGDINHFSVLGYSLTNLTNSFEDYFRQCAERGGTLRFLLVDPKSEAGKMIASHEDPNRHPNGVNDTISCARRIKQACPQGTVEVKKIASLPSCSILLSNPKDKNSIAMVTLYPPYFTTPVDRRHHLYFKKQENHRFYNSYVEQFEKLWKEGTTVNLEN